jgi:hypothetical protein
MAFLCVSQQGTRTRGVQKHHKKLFGESPCQEPVAKKVEGIIFLPVVFSHRFFVIAFLAVSLHEEWGAQKHHHFFFFPAARGVSKSPQKKVPWCLSRLPPPFP